MVTTCTSMGYWKCLKYSWIVELKTCYELHRIYFGYIIVKMYFRLNNLEMYYRLHNL